MRNTDVVYRLNIDLKTKKRVRCPQIVPYAIKYGVTKKNMEYGNSTYVWTEEQYQQLLKEFEE